MKISPSLLLLSLVLFLLPARASAQNSTYADSTICAELHQLLHEQQYSELTERIRGGAPHECLGWDVSGGASHGKWVPGRAVVRFLDGLLGRNRSSAHAYTLLSITLSQPQSSERDELAKLLLSKTEKLRIDILWYHLFTENSSNLRSIPLLRQLYDLTPAYDRDAHFFYTLNNGFFEYAEWFIADYGYHKAKYSLAANSWGNNPELFNRLMEKVGCAPRKANGLQAAQLLSTCYKDVHPFHYPTRPNIKSKEEWAKFIRVLKKNGASFKYRDNHGHDLLQQAVFTGNEPLARALKQELSWDFGKKDPDGRSLLHLAALSHSWGTMDFVLERSPELHQKDKAGKEPWQHLEKWNIIMIEKMEGELGQKDQNTLKLYHLAQKPDLNYSPEDEAFLTEMDQHFEYNSTLPTREGGTIIPYNTTQIYTIASRSGSRKLLNRIAEIREASRPVSQRELNREHLEAEDWDWFHSEMPWDQKNTNWFKKTSIEAYNQFHKNAPRADTLLRILMANGYTRKEENSHVNYYLSEGKPLFSESPENILPIEGHPFALIRRKGKWGIQSLTDKPILKCEWESLRFLTRHPTDFGNTWYYLARKNGTQRLITIRYFVDLEKRLDTEWDRGNIIQCINYRNGTYLLTEKDGKIGLCYQRMGKIENVLRNYYQAIEILKIEDTYSIRLKVKKEGLWGYFRGNMDPWKIKFRYEKIMNGPSGTILGYRKGKWHTL